MLDAYRWKHKLTMRQLAKQIGTSPATLMRIEHGMECDIATLMKIMNWMTSE